MKYLLILAFTFLSLQGAAQRTWLPVVHRSPDYNNGVMLLLSDGRVLAKSCHGDIDTLGNTWDVLTPDINGSYVNGTWSRADTSHYRRLYCSSQVLRDGHVYIAGGEYGNGAANGEVYDPLSGHWTMNGPLRTGDRILDGNSEMLPDGRVLQAYVSGGSKGNYFFDPATGNYSAAPACLGSHDESAWLKLPDNSILFVDIGSRNSERYIPHLNTWVRDAAVPVALYDSFGFETGASFLLPDGRGFFIGSVGTTAYYTPSGNDSPGHWDAGPIIPDGLGAPDAVAAMMPNGKILCTLSRRPTAAEEFPDPTYFYEFDYRTSAFTKVPAPTGPDTMETGSYATAMLCLPDGSMLFAPLDSNQYYVYVPGGTQLAAGMPVVDTVIEQDCHTWTITGTGFNGISQGASYGDDWQMHTNYPLVRLIRHNGLYGDSVCYARTYNWNSTGVMRGTAPDTVHFTLPAFLPEGNYDLEVVANGIHSASYPFTTCNTEDIAPVASAEDRMTIYPNPVSSVATLQFASPHADRYEVRVIDILGREVLRAVGNSVAGQNSVVLDLSGFTNGVYSVVVNDDLRWSQVVVIHR